MRFIIGALAAVMTAATEQYGGYSGSSRDYTRYPQHQHEHAHKYSADHHEKHDAISAALSQIQSDLSSIQTNTNDLDRDLTNFASMFDSDLEVVQGNQQTVQGAIRDLDNDFDLQRETQRAQVARVRQLLFEKLALSKDALMEIEETILGEKLDTYTGLALADAVVTLIRELARDFNFGNLSDIRDLGLEFTELIADLNRDLDDRGFELQKKTISGAQKRAAGPIRTVTNDGLIYDTLIINPNPITVQAGDRQIFLAEFCVQDGETYEINLNMSRLLDNSPVVFQISKDYTVLDVNSNLSDNNTPQGQSIQFRETNTSGEGTIRIIASTNTASPDTLVDSKQMQIRIKIYDASQTAVSTNLPDPCDG